MLSYNFIIIRYLLLCLNKLYMYKLEKQSVVRICSNLTDFKTFSFILKYKYFCF